MIRPLIVTLPLLEGETPSGYVSRLAQLYKTTPRNLCSSLGLRWPYLCSGREDEIERLSWLTGQDYKSLMQWTATKHSVGRYCVGNATTSTAVIRRTACRCCPHCVYEAREQVGVHGVFELVEWKVLSLHRCEKHGMQFITLPSAAHSHEAYDFATQAALHWSLIEDAYLARKELPSTLYEEYVRRRIRHGAGSDWLVSLDLSTLHGACSSLGAALKGVKTDLVRNIDVSLEHRLSEVGFLHLVDGPEGLRRALRKLRENSLSERPYYSSDLGSMYNWLSSVSDDSSLAEIVDVTREFIFQNYPVSLNKEIFGVKPKHEIWLTMDEARKRSGFGAVFLKKLLGYIDGIDEKYALRRTDVKASELAKVQAFWLSLMNLARTADALSVRSDQVKALMRYGVLKQVRITSTLRYALRDEVNALLKRIEELPSAIAPSAFLPIQQFCREKGIPLAKVVSDLMSGDHEGRFRRGFGFGLSSIEVAVETPKTPTEILLDRDLTLSDTAKYLKISIISIRKLRDAGFLCALNKLNPDTKHLKAFITQDSVQKFEAEYATLGQIAYQRGMAPIHLARQLDREDVLPISFGGTIVRVYEKKDAMAAGFKFGGVE